jgi:hypothetical protein
MGSALWNEDHPARYGRALRDRENPATQRLRLRRDLGWQSPVDANDVETPRHIHAIGEPEPTVDSLVQGVPYLR